MSSFAESGNKQLVKWRELLYSELVITKSSLPARDTQQRQILPARLNTSPSWDLIQQYPCWCRCVFICRSPVLPGTPSLRVCASLPVTLRYRAPYAPRSPVARGGFIFLLRCRNTDAIPHKSATSLLWQSQPSTR